MGAARDCSIALSVGKLLFAGAVSFACVIAPFSAGQTGAPSTPPSAAAQKAAAGEAKQVGRTAFDVVIEHPYLALLAGLLAIAVLLFVAMAPQAAAARDFLKSLIGKGQVVPPEAASSSHTPAPARQTTEPRDVTTLFLDPAHQLMTFSKKNFKFVLKDYRCEVHIGEGYSVEHVRTGTWSAPAAGRDVPYLSHGYSGDGDVSLADVRFTAKVLNSVGTVEVIPAEDGAWKRYLVFLVPPLFSGGPSVQVETRARWPRSCVKLAKPMEWDYQTVRIPDNVAEAVDSVTFRIQILTGDGEYDVEEDGFVPDKRTYDDKESSEPKGIIRSSYEAIALQVPAKERLQVKLRRRKP